jgi:hypothetical protein
MLWFLSGYLDALSLVLVKGGEVYQAAFLG